MTRLVRREHAMRVPFAIAFAIDEVVPQPELGQQQPRYRHVDGKRASTSKRHELRRARDGDGDGAESADGKAFAQPGEHVRPPPG